MPTIQLSRGLTAWSLIDMLLLGLLGFLSCFGEGMQEVFQFNVSRVFPVLCLLAIARALKNRSSSGIPPAMWLFLGFVALHSAIVYGFVFPEEFGFGYTGQKVLQERFVRQEEAVGMLLLRFALFTLAAWAVGRLWTPRGGLCLSFGWCMGLLTTLSLGGYRTEGFTLGTYGQRLAAGFLDPNALGLFALCCLYLQVLNLSFVRTEPAKAICSAAALACGIMIVLSGSRGSVVGLAVGMLFLVTKRGMFGTVLRAALGTVAAWLVLVCIDPVFIDAIANRLSFSRISEDQGAGRLMIWCAYGRHVADYFLWGTGFARSTGVVVDDYELRSDAPHSILLGIFVEFGILGVVLFGRALLAIAGRLSLLPPDQRRRSLALLAAWFGQSLFLDTLGGRASWLVLGVCYALSSGRHLFFNQGRPAPAGQLVSGGNRDTNHLGASGDGEPGRH